MADKQTDNWTKKDTDRSTASTAATDAPPSETALPKQSTTKYAFSGEYKSAASNESKPYTFKCALVDDAVGADSSPVSQFKKQVHDDSSQLSKDFRKQYPDFGRLATHYQTSPVSVEDTV